MKVAGNDVGAGRIVVLVGPTAVGKSRLALQLAERLNGEIVTADSRQVYRYMDVGTDKPTPHERAGVRHHMLDLVSPDETYSVVRFAREGRRVLDAIAFRGRTAIVAGGTGFYVDALLAGTSVPPVPPNAVLREQLQSEAQREGSVALHERLRVLDPRSAERVHANNVPRIIRALEVIEALGGPVPERTVDEIPALYLGLSMPRETLYAVADARVERQFSGGLVEETETLLRMGYTPEMPALDGFAYRQAVAYLRGEMTASQATEQYKMETHKFIRRQMTWFRRNARIHWIESGDQALDAALAAIEAGRVSG